MNIFQLLRPSTVQLFLKSAILFKLTKRVIYNHAHFDVVLNPSPKNEKKDVNFEGFSAAIYTVNLVRIITMILVEAKWLILTLNKKIQSECI